MSTMQRLFRSKTSFVMLLVGCLPLLSRPVVPSDPALFVRGDVNADGTLDVSDPMSLLGCQFLGRECPPCAKAADSNDDGRLDLSDALFLLRFLFQGGPQPPAPEFCGSDPTADRLTCQSYAHCGVRDLSMLSWPVSGKDGKEWVINNYVDLDPTAGKEDYMGNTGNAAKVYDGHSGIDIDVATFRAMDNDEVFALAAAPGVVTMANDPHEDRHTSCVNYNWNVVVLEHADGSRTTYGHLKKDSILVTVGQTVAAGEQLGVLGSSGCSTAPHLHFVVRDKDNNVVDPFLQNLWVHPPVYDTPLSLMDASLRNGAISNDDQVKDPPPNVTSLHVGETLGVGLSVAGGGPGDTMEVIIHDGNDSLFHIEKTTLQSVHRHSFWRWNYEISDAVGTWTVQIRTNGTLEKVYHFTVSYAPGSWLSRHHVSAGNYQGVFNSCVQKGFRPVWIDGYNVKGDVYYNAIFLLNDDGIQWQAKHGLTSGQYQTFFSYCMNSGYRLLNLDCYRSGFSIRYAAIFVKVPGTPQVGYHGLTAAEHQAQFSSLASQGYRPVNISVESLLGIEYYSAFYDKEDVGGWVTYSGLTSSQYQAEFEKQAMAGRSLQYLNGFNDNGVVKFSAIWNSAPAGSWVSRHNLSSAEYQSQFNHWTGQGMRLRFLTGYQNGNNASFAGCWAK